MSLLAAPLLFEPRFQHRQLTGCVLASLALHAALLTLSPGFRYREESARFLTATLMRPEPNPAPARPARGTRLARHEQLPHQIALATPPVAPSAAVPAAAPAPQAQWQETVSAAAAPHAAEVALPRSTSTQSSQASGTPDAGNVDQYRIALMGAAKRYKRYPSQAVENGWTGKVEVHLVVARDGGVGSVHVKNSSGYAILDEQALDMIRRAEGVTPIPPALQGRQFSVDIPVVFELQTG